MPEVTPFELRIRSELDLEQHRFGNEWLFPWHSLNIEGRTVNVDRFDGGRIRLGGCTFGGQQQSIYWQAIGRYLNGKVHSTFKRWDDETRTYPSELRRSSLDGTGKLLTTFIAGIVRRSIETDQALRGKGYPKKDIPPEGSAVHSHANLEVYRLIESYRALLGKLGGLAAIVQRIEAFGTTYRGILTILGIIAAVVFGVWRIFLG